MFGHTEALLYSPELVVGADHEVGGLGCEVGGVALPARQPASLGLQVAVDAFGRPGEFEAALQLRKPFSLNNGVRERGMSHDID